MNANLIVKPYSTGVVAATNYRLCKMTYKADKETKIKPESKCVEIPAQLSQTNDYAQLREAINYWFAETQDEIIKSLVADGVTEIHPDEISATAVSMWIAESQVSGRLNKDAIIAWFEEEMETKLMLQIATKLGIDLEAITEADEKRIANTVAVYSSKLASLASGKTQYNETEVKQLLRAFEVAEINAENASEIAAKLLAKLNAMLTKPKEILLEL